MKKSNMSLEEFAASDFDSLRPSDLVRVREILNGDDEAKKTKLLKAFSDWLTKSVIAADKQRSNSAETVDRVHVSMKKLAGTGLVSVKGGNYVVGSSSLPTWRYRGSKNDGRKGKYYISNYRTQRYLNPARLSELLNQFGTEIVNDEQDGQLLPKSN